jgi:hypothetical protein
MASVTAPPPGGSSALAHQDRATLAASTIQLPALSRLVGGSICALPIVEFLELLYLLVWGDIQMRYKETFIGAPWVWKVAPCFASELRC